MANQYINNMAALWNSAGTTYAAIKMNVTNAASSATSKLIQMQVGAVDKFSVDKLGSVTAAGIITATGGLVTAGTMLPATNDTAALGTSGTAWSDLFLASGGVINWAAGDITITHGTNQMLFGGAAAGYLFDAPIKPSVHDSTSIGQIGTAWSDIFLAIGAVIDFGSTDVTITHTTDALTVGGGDFRVPLAGADTASVVTVGAAQTLTGKTLTNPVLNSPTINTPTITTPTVTGTMTAAVITASGAISSSTTITATTSVTAPLFKSASTSLTLATTGAGSISLRPNGSGSATGEAILSSAGNLTLAGTLAVASLPSTVFTTDTSQTIANAASKVVLTDTNIGQGSAANWMFQSAGASGDAFISFHSPGAFAAQFGMRNTGQFCKGGWSYGAVAYRFWDEQNIPLGAIGDISGSSGAYKLYTGAAIESRMSQWRDNAVNTSAANVGPWYGTNVSADVVGGVGFFLRIGNTAAYGANSTIPGGNLGWGNAAGNANGSPGGSWRCLGFVQSGSTTTGASTCFMRYA